VNLLEHEDLKNELKVLYTAITRTRLRLIMYDIQGDDVDFSKKKIFEKLMANFDLFEKMTKENFDGLVINFFYYDKNKIRY
jgi:hypothetical protein